MALINCPECDKQISSDAGTCPHCGKRGLKPSIWPRTWIEWIVLFLFWSTVIGFAGWAFDVFILGL